jgi:hypothetical protein
MLQIPKVLLSDEFRNELREDIDFSSITHKTKKIKQRKITDAMTQLLINTCDKWEHHKDYPLWNVVKLTRHYQKQIDNNNFQPFQEALTENNFVINHSYRPPTNQLGGITKSVLIPEDKIRMTIDYLASTTYESVVLNDEIFINWNNPFYFGENATPTSVRINTSALHTFCKSVKDVSSDLHRKWNLQLRLSVAQENDGWLKQNYRVSDFGRLVGTGLSSLQTMPKTLLKEILNGCYEIDVNASSMSLLPTIYKRVVGKPLTFPSTENYVRNREVIRDAVSLSLGVDLEMVKQAFTAIGFGLRRNVKGYKDVDGNYIIPTLTEIFGSQKIAKTFVEHPQVEQLWIEVSEIFSGLSKETKSSLPELKPSQRVSYLYQHSEAEMLKVMMKYVGKSLVIPKHDAVVVNSPLTIGQLGLLKDKIYKSTGFNVSLSQRLV